MARVGVTPSGAIGADELEAIVLGAAMYGSGGGGTVESGTRLAADVRSAMADTPVGLVALRDLPAEARIAVPAAVPRARSLPSIAAAATAFRALAERSGDPFDAVVAPDLSVHSALVALGVAAACEVPVVDTAGSIRAATALDMTTWAAADVAPGIVVLADTADVVVLESESLDGADKAARAVLAGDALRGPIGLATWAMNAGALRRSSIPAALSALCATGAAAVDARARGADPVAALAGSIDRAVVAGRGRLGQVTVVLDQRREHVEIRIDTPSGPFEVVSVDSHVQLRSPQGVLVGAPDLISVVSAEGTPLGVRELTSPELAGTDVAVVVAPTPVIAPARVPTEAFDAIHASLGTAGPVPFGIHQLDP